MRIFAFSGALALTLLSACSADVSTTAELSMQERAHHARDFSVKLTNVTPYTFAKSGVFNTKVGATMPGPLGPGDEYVFSFTAGKGQSLSFALMLGESNDWFFSPDGGGIALYDDAGKPVSGDVTNQISLWDVGSEINEEPGVGADTGPNQSSPNQGAPDADPRVRRLGSKVVLANGSTFHLPVLTDMIQVTVSSDPVTRLFTVHVHNCSSASTLVTSKGARAIHLSPGVFVTHGGVNPLFTEGAVDRGEGLADIAESGNVMRLAAAVGARTGVVTGFSPGVWKVHQVAGPFFFAGNPDRRLGLEHLAEDGNPTELASNLQASLAGRESTGVFNTPDGHGAPGPVLPGASFTFKVTATKGDRLSLATMFGASDDWIASTAEEGIALFDPNGMPLSGDVSADMSLWDVGTEVNEELGIGADTGPQQPAPDTGAPDANPAVRIVTRAEYAPPVSTHLMVTLTPQ